jgi:hypothetical protein
VRTSRYQSIIDSCITINLASKHVNDVILPGACPEFNEEILHGVNPEPDEEILPFVQNDKAKGSE